jgi:PAS domain S-box-containing protein
MIALPAAARGTMPAEVEDMKSLRSIERWRSLGLVASVVAALTASAPRASAQDAVRVIRVAIDREYEPYEFVDERGSAQGFTPALLRVIGEDAGIRFEFVPLDWPSALAALGTGDVELINMIRTPERTTQYEFSTPHSRITQAIFHRHDAADLVDLASLAGHVVALQKDDISVERLAGRRDFRRRITTSKLDALMNLSVGHVDAVVCAEQAGVRLVAKYRLTDIDVAAGELFPQDFAFATRLGNRALITMLDRHLARLRASGDLEALRLEWLDGRLTRPSWAEKHAKSLLALGGLLGTIVLLLLTWNRSLQRRVLAATAHVRERKRFLSGVIENSGALIFAKDREGRYVLINRKWEQVTGLSREDVIGKDDRELFPGAAGERFRANDLAVMESGELQDYEESLTTHETSYVFHSIKFPVLDAAGVVNGMCGMATDITVTKAAEQKLRDALQEKEALVMEVHHRVKNNLQVMVSLLGLQLAQSDEHCAPALRDSQERIRSMALIHEQLYQSSDLSRIDLADYARTLTVGLVSVFGRSSAVRVDVESAPLWVSVDTAIPCGLILNELVSNALKYAFPEGRSGGVVVGLSATVGDTGTREVTLTVTDDGVGLPDALDPAQTPSLGLRLVQILAKQLRGAVVARRGPGARFEVTVREKEAKR